MRISRPRSLRFESLELRRVLSSTPTLVSDLTPGPDSSFDLPGQPPPELTAAGEDLFFVFQGDLWQSDGSQDGTARVREFDLPATAPRNLTAVGETLFFASGNDLWKSDGSEASTVLVQPAVSPELLTALGGVLFFNGFDAVNGRELWRSDGTLEGTNVVKHIFPGSGSANPLNLTPVDDTLFFSATNGSVGRQLWKSDGSENGSVLVSSQFIFFSTATSAEFVNVDGSLFFAPGVPAAGVPSQSELWTSDGTAAGTILLRDFGEPTGPPSNLTAVGETLFFVSEDDLWKSDGTVAGTVPVSLNLAPQNLADLDGTLLFSALDGVAGRELWRSDGTDDGTQQVKNIRPDQAFSPLSSDPSLMTRMSGRMFFSADDTGAPPFASRNGTGRELWVSEAAEATTELVDDIYAGVDIFGNPFSSDPLNLTQLNRRPAAIDDQADTQMDSAVTIDVLDNDFDIDGSLFLTAEDGVHGRELWQLTVAGAIDPATVTITLAAARGALDVDPDTGEVTYAPDPGFSGADTFAYTVWDHDGAESDEAIVSIAVQSASQAWQNPSDPLDVSADPLSTVSPLDALLVINELRAGGARFLPAPTPGFSPPPYVDTNGDGAVSPIDALLVLIHLDEVAGSSSAEAEPLELRGTAAAGPSPLDLIAFDISQALQRDKDREGAHSLARVFHTDF